MTSSLRGNCNMNYSNEFFVINKLLKKCWQHAYNHISPFYILECFTLWFGSRTSCSNHYVTRDLRASVLFIACLSPFLGLGYLPYIHYSYPLAFTDSLVSTMRSHAVLCFFQWETWHSLKNEKIITLSIKHDIGDKKVKHVHFGENISIQINSPKY